MPTTGAPTSNLNNILVMSSFPNDQSVSTCLSDIAVLIVPDIVLLPGSLQPLFLTEQQHRLAVDAANLTSGLIAVARPRDVPRSANQNTIASNDNEPMIGLGKLAEAEVLSKDRYHVLIEGVARIKLLDHYSKDNIHRASVELVEDASVHSHLLSQSYNQLLAMCDQLAFSPYRGTAELRDLVRSHEDPVLCADMVSGALIADIDHRQRLLETTDPLVRLNETLSHLGRILVELTPRSAVPN